MTDPVLLDATELSAAIRRREVSCVEVMSAYLSHIEKLNPQVNAIVSMQDGDRLLEEARYRDRQLAAGQYLGWMHGFPHAVKDLADVAGFPTTKGSPIFAGTIATTDSLFVRRIKAAGAIIVGKTNTPEFGLGSHTFNPVFGTTRNPYDLSRTAGGSSGGAAAALATRMVPVADGSDFGGSLRNPAAYNNVIGFRPAFGRVPEPGFVSHPSVAGPMGRTVSDVAMLLSVMAGPDRTAPLSIEEDPRRFTEDLLTEVSGTRIAWVGDYDGYLPTEPGVLELCRSSFAAFESIGCVVEEALPSMSPERVWETFVAWRHWLLLDSLGDYYANPATRAQLKPEAVYEVEGGLPMTALDVVAALRARNEWYVAVDALLERYDYILAPTAQVFPFDAELRWPTEIAGRTMDTYHRWMETVAAWTLAGLPVINLPVGFNAAGLPMGVQLIGRNHGERDLLGLAYAYEQATQWVKHSPPPLL